MQEVQHVAVLDHVSLALGAHLAGVLGALFAAAGDEIAAAYENCDYNRAMRLVMELADRANPFVEAAAPWNLRKDPAKAGELQNVCTVALNLFRQLVVYLTPILPDLAEKCGELLGDEQSGQIQAIGFSLYSELLERAVALAREAASETGAFVLGAVVLVLAGFAYKMSVVPFHFWTPDVYEGSPTPVTAVFAAAPKAAGFALLLALMAWVWPALGLAF